MVDVLSRTDTCVGKVLTLDEVEREPQFKVRQMFVERETP